MKNFFLDVANSVCTRMFMRMNAERVHVLLASRGEPQTRVPALREIVTWLGSSRSAEVTTIEGKIWRL